MTFSSTEAEYRGAIIAAREVIWLKKILKDLGVSINSPTLIYYDNLNNIHLARNLIFHVQIKYHFIREHVVCWETGLSDEEEHQPDQTSPKERTG